MCFSRDPGKLATQRCKQVCALKHPPSPPSSSSCYSGLTRSQFCANPCTLLLLLPVQHRGLSPLLRLLASASAAVQYNAAFALYELSEAREHGLIICQAGGLQQLYSCRQRLQVKRGVTQLRGGAAACCS